MAERHVVPQNLDLLTGFVLDDGERGVGVGRLGVVVHLEIFELGASDDVLLLLDGQGVPLRHVVEVLLDDDVTAACEIRILVTDGDRDVSGLPGRFSVPSTKPMRSRCSKYLNPWTSSITDAAPANLLVTTVANSKHRSI